MMKKIKKTIAIPQVRPSRLGLDDFDCPGRLFKTDDGRVFNVIIANRGGDIDFVGMHEICISE